MEFIKLSFYQYFLQFFYTHILGKFSNCYSSFSSFVLEQLFPSLFGIIYEFLIVIYIIFNNKEDGNIKNLSTDVLCKVTLLK